MLPEDVVSAADLRPGDQVDWRFEDGEIRGRKLPRNGEPRVIVAPLVRKAGVLVANIEGLTLTPNSISDALEEERRER